MARAGHWRHLELSQRGRESEGFDANSPLNSVARVHLEASRRFSGRNVHAGRDRNSSRIGIDQPQHHRRRGVDGALDVTCPVVELPARIASGSAVKVCRIPGGAAGRGIGEEGGPGKRRGALADELTEVGENGAIAVGACTANNSSSPRTLIKPGVVAKPGRNQPRSTSMGCGATGSSFTTPVHASPRLTPVTACPSGPTNTRLASRGAAEVVKNVMEPVAVHPCRGVVTSTESLISVPTVSGSVRSMTDARSEPLTGSPGVAAHW